MLVHRPRTGKQKVACNYRVLKKQTNKMQSLSQDQSLLFSLSLPCTRIQLQPKITCVQWILKSELNPNPHWTILNSITLHRALNRILLQSSSPDWPRDSLGSAALSKWSKVTLGSAFYMFSCTLFSKSNTGLKRKHKYWHRWLEVAWPFRRKVFGNSVLAAPWKARPGHKEEDRKPGAGHVSLAGSSAAG